MEPSMARAWAMLAAVTIEQDDTIRLTQAITRMEMLAPDGSRDFLVQITKAQLSLRKKEWLAARDAFEAALETKPNSAHVIEWALKMDMALADKPSARKRADKLLTLSPKNATGHYVKGSLYLMDGKIEQAEAHFRDSISAHETPQALNDLAWLLYESGKLEEAEGFARGIFKINDQMFQAWDTLGVILMTKGDLEGAEAAFREALKIHTEDPQVHLHMAQVLFAKGDSVNAKETVKMVETRRSSLSAKDQEALKELADKLTGR